MAGGAGSVVEVTTPEPDVAASRHPALFTSPVLVLTSTPSWSDAELGCGIETEDGEQLGAVRLVNAGWAQRLDRVAGGKLATFEFEFTSAGAPFMYVTRPGFGRRTRHELLEVSGADGSPTGTLTQNNHYLSMTRTFTIATPDETVAHTTREPKSTAIRDHTTKHPIARITPVNERSVGKIDFYDYVLRFVRPPEPHLWQLCVAATFADYFHWRVDTGGFIAHGPRSGM